MDVSPFYSRRLWSAFGIGLLLVSGCGNRFDLATSRGRQARIDEANFLLSKGNCASALEAIDPVYNSPDVDDEVRIVKASAHACAGTFNLLTLIGNLAGASNFLSVLAKSLSNSPADGARSAFFAAIDVLTQNGTRLSGSQRTPAVNNYMVFVQLGTIGSILRNYGSPTAEGAQGANLVYDGNGGSPANEMSNLDACALSSALSILTDSFTYSSLKDADTAAVTNNLNTICTGAGLTSCSDLNKSRTACDGANAISQQAELVVSGINAAW